MEWNAKYFCNLLPYGMPAASALPPDCNNLTRHNPLPPCCFFLFLILKNTFPEYFHCNQCNNSGQSVRKRACP